MMATAFGRILEEGHWAEGAIVSILNSSGAQAVASTPEEDHRSKVDLWCRRQPVGSWIPIQLSTNRTAIVGPKGMDALRRGVVPNFVDGQTLEAAVDGDEAIRQRVVCDFWSHVDQVVTTFHPRLQQPHRNLTAVA